MNYRELKKQNEMKRFILSVYEAGQLDDVVEGLEIINKYVTKQLQNPPEEAPTLEEEELQNEFDEEGFEYE